MLGPAEDEETCLTKAKLFTITSEDGSWTEIGVGSVAVTIDADDATLARIDMVTFDEPREVLLSTPVAIDDIYVVQKDSILLWSDPEIGRDMACSFNAQEGCKHVMKQIMAYQKSRRRPHNGGSSFGAPPSHSSSALVRDESNDFSSSPWSVRRENLPALIRAAHDNQQRIGKHICETPAFVSDLIQLFYRLHKEGDIVGKRHIADVMRLLLAPPFNTEGKIISQFVEETTVDACIDIVQFSLGRQSVETGFEDRETRRAKFRDPLKLPEALVKRAHLLFACNYLKDLLPLSLEEGDAMSMSLLSVFLLRFKFALIQEILKSDQLLRNAFAALTPTAVTAAGIDPSTAQEMRFELLSFCHDVCVSVKAAVIPMSPKEEMLTAFIDRDLLVFVSMTVRLALNNLTNLNSLATTPTSTGLLNRTLQLACDIVAHVGMFAAETRDELILEAADLGDDCLLSQLLRIVAVVDDPLVLQSCYDAVVSCGIGLLQSMSVTALTQHIHPKRREVLRFWVEGVVVVTPPPSAATTPAAPIAAAAQGTSALAAAGSDATAKTTAAARVVKRLAAPPLQRLIETVAQFHASADLTAMSRSSAGLSPSPPVAAKAEHDDSSKQLPTGAATPQHQAAARMSDCCSAGSRMSTGGRLSSSSPVERHALQSLRVLVAVMKDSVVFNSAALPAACESAHLFEAIAAICSPALGPTSASSSSTNLRGTAVAFLSAVIETNVASLLRLVRECGAADACVELFLVAGKRNNVLGSELRHMLQVVHSSVHSKKSHQSHVSPLQRFSPEVTRSPFIDSLTRTADRVEDLTSAALSLSAQQQQPSALQRQESNAAVDISLVQHIIARFGERLSTAAPDVLASLQKVIAETPEEAHQEDEKSNASTTTERMLISDDDFKKLLEEYGPDAPVPPTCDVVTSLGGVDPIAKTPEELVALLAKREPSVRPRSLSNGNTNKSDEPAHLLPPLSPEAKGAAEQGGADESGDEPQKKRSRQA